MMFTVDAPGRVTYISRPNPDSLWSADTLLYGVQPAASWGILGLLAPGATTPSVSFESVGLPGILATWAQGKWPIPTCCDDDPPAAPSEDPLEMHSVKGKTVGVDPWPSDRSAQSLLARLRALTQQVCSTPLLWITDSTICSGLLLDIDQAESARASGNPTLAKIFLVHYKSMLSAGSSAGSVTSSGFWLLTPNADLVESII